MVKNNDILLESVPCCLGCLEDDQILFKGHDLLHDLPGEYYVVQCRTCGLMRTNPRPTPECIGIYYPDNYGPYLGTVVDTGQEKQGVGIKQYLKPIVNRIFDFNGTVLPFLKPGRLLEVGCASGSFLHRMAMAGWEVQGIEFCL